MLCLAAKRLVLPPRGTTTATYCNTTLEMYWFQGVYCIQYIAVHHYIMLHHASFLKVWCIVMPYNETLDQVWLSNQRQLEEPQEEEAARSPVPVQIDGGIWNMHPTTGQLNRHSNRLSSDQATRTKGNMGDIVSSLDGEKAWREMAVKLWGASSTSSVFCCVPGQLIWINGVSWGCPVAWRHLAWFGTTSNLKQWSLRLTHQKQHLKCWFRVEGCWNENFCTVQLVQQLHSCCLKTCRDLLFVNFQIQSLPDMHAFPVHQT